ncbi:PREDICTED: dedicator of cytokinesis protein 10-like, partial [Amphimedon queenslandica]|uniref:PH domain-containing protein n=1 Tax=Amphimedon queenslandica TaxID=400682 RepID=A0A1X7SUW3_AMPQE
MGLSIKNYRKRWFELRGGPSAGGYRLVYYRDERSSAAKGTIHLEACTDIRPNSKLRTFGFDIVTEDEKTVYPLATETQKEMEEWLLTLGKAIGLIEEEDTTSIKGSVAAKYRSYYAKDTLRDTTKKTLHRPELLHWDDKKEREDRNKNRNDLFLLYPELLHQAPLDDTVSLPLPYKEVLHHQVTVICKELSLKLTLSRHGKKQLLEPFYVRLSLFDAAKGMKISEDFHIDFNESESLIRDDTESTDDTDINKLARTTNQ